MTTPYYTATAGPADVKASGRAKAYAGLAVFFPLVSALATFGLLTSDQANSINGFITAGIGLMGAFGLAGFGVAASKTKSQVDNGTFDRAPELPAVPALEQIKILRDAADQELNRGVDAAKASADVITSIIGGIPVIGGPLSAATGNVIDSADDLLGRFR